MLLLLNEFDATTLAALLLFDEAMESRTFPPPYSGTVVVVVHRLRGVAEVLLVCGIV
ncbi:hypothetical protein GYH30_034650 [Glycine max]|nr:hypothetical protein GYH30_034650 [Glycine max]